MIAAGVLVLVAAGTLGYFVLHDFVLPRPAPQSTGRSRPSASATPSLGQFGHIASRQTDPQPLTVAQLFPVTFSYEGATVTSTATSLGGNCAAATVGANLQSALSSADCTQVARATYLSVSQGLMGTIGVLNLSTAQRSATAANSAGPSDYISQLAGPSGFTQKIGQGTGIEQAVAKGHYLILIWAEFTNLGKPDAQQTTQLENFMTGLLQNTANVSLSTRMLTGAP
jgi:hypothetical protein